MKTWRAAFIILFLGVLRQGTALSSSNYEDLMEEFEPVATKSTFINPFMDWYISSGPGLQWPKNKPHPSSNFPGFPNNRPKTPTDREDVTEKYLSLKGIEKIETRLADANMEYINSEAFISPFGGLLDSFMGTTKQTPWWKGPNVCIEREEVDDEGLKNSSERTLTDGFFYTSTSVNMQTCLQTKRKYECIQKIKNNSVSKTKTIRYLCCSGYQRRNNECEKVDLLPLLDTIKKFNGTEFLLLAGDIENIFLEQNLTIFLPSNEAFLKYANKAFESNQIDLSDPKKTRSAEYEPFSPTNLIEGHITRGFQEICPDDSFDSLYKNSTLRLKYVVSSQEEPQYLVNCAKVISSNNYAENGIIHTIDRVLMPATRTIMETLKKKERFSTLASILEKTGLANSLDSNEIWTLFAPTNKAFDNLQKTQPQLMEKLIKGDACTLNLLKHHMLSHTFCSSAVELGATGVQNSIGEYLQLSRKNKNSNKIDTVYDDTKAVFLINKIAVTEADIIATNGVIHVIDEIIIPDSALPMSALLLKKNLTMFHSLIKKSKMLEEINSLSNVTFLVPTDKAIKHYIKHNGDQNDFNDYMTQKEMTDDEKKDLRAFISQHIIDGVLLSDTLENNIWKDTIGEGFPVRVNLYSTSPILSNVYNRATIDCARLLHFDTLQCDNILHQIDRPLMPHNVTLLEKIRDTPKLSMLYKILHGTEVEEILENSDNITFLAPTNEVFEKMTKDDYNILLKNKKLVDTLLKLHTLQDVTCCAGLHNLAWPFSKKLSTMNGQSLIIGNNKIGSATLTSCDHMGSNGVLHYTNKMMIPNTIATGKMSLNPNVDILLYGLSDI